MESQRDYILRDLLRGAVVTPMDALEDYGCFRLSARINDLRNEGYNIETKIISNNGKKYAGYYFTDEELKRLLG